MTGCATVTPTRVLDILRPLTAVSDGDECLAKTPAYSILAILWGQTPGVDNVDYPTLGVPKFVADDDLDRAEVVQAALDLQARVAAAVYTRLTSLVEEYGVETVLRVIVTHAHQANQFWYTACRFVDAETAHGPHPAGITVTATRTPGRVPGIQRTAYTVTHTAA